MAPSPRPSARTPRGRTRLSSFLIVILNSSSSGFASSRTCVGGSASGCSWFDVLSLWMFAMIPTPPLVGGVLSRRRCTSERMSQSNQVPDRPQLRHVGAPLDQIDAERVSQRQGDGDQRQRIDTEIVAKRCLRVERARRRTHRILENQRHHTRIHVHVRTLLPSSLLPSQSATLSRRKY